MGRPIVEAVAAQQRIIDQQSQMLARQAAQIDFIGKVAGISEHLAGIGVTADVNNPAQPWPDPPSAPPSETTQEAATAEAHDDPRALGETPGSMQHLPATQIDNPLNVGESLPTSPVGTVTDVTQPVAGTNTGEIPIPSVRTEVDVRVGNPDDPNPAFPWTLGNRTMAALRVARLRIAAGLASGDDLVVAAEIEKDASITDGMLVHEMEILGKVASAQPRRAQRTARRAVPAAGTVERTTPSLAPSTGGLSSMASAASIDDGDAESIFL